MKNYELQGDAFIIRDYDRQSPFTSFLPGLAGVRGIPMWSFYVNRGQGITSFGIHNKGNAMMEFNPANTGYEVTQIKGFRTFLRVGGRLIQPFFRHEEGVARTMEIRRNALTLREERPGLRMTVTYIVLPGEEIGALVRRVELENTGGEPLSLELLDGMPQIIPYGITLDMYKGLSNLFKSWTDIVNLDRNAPIFKMRASGDDSAEVKEITGGYYYLVLRDGAAAPAPLIVDRGLIFGGDQTLMEPEIFAREGLVGTAGPQVFANKVPCAFVPLAAELAPGESLAFTAYAGYAPSGELLNRKAGEFAAPGYWQRKLEEARRVAEELTAPAATRTGDPLFDQYVRQCYLDNFLRGGVPYLFGEGEGRKVVHLFSRKHGDPERDYNFFSIAGEYYSQGNGNYRDVCQNRRHDVFFCPQVGDFDLRNFFSLVQLDGYNPLEIRPTTFAVRDPQAARRVVEEFLPDGAEPLLKVLERPFTPGEIPSALAAHGLAPRGDLEELVARLLTLSDQRFEAGAGEGYWSDHFDYDLDLLEDYLSVWPDKKGETLFERPVYTAYDNALTVRPSREKTVLSEGKVRQYGAVAEDEEKAARPGFDPQGTNWVKDSAGRVMTFTLFEKLLLLAGNKTASLDPELLGVSMEAGKPGWNDAMNGLPGLFGSSMPETLELRRVVAFSLAAARERDPGERLALPVEIWAFLKDTADLLAGEAPYFPLTQRRESYRAQVRLGLSGQREAVPLGEIAGVLAAYQAVLDRAVARALEIGGGVMPTFFTYEVTDWEPLKNPDGSDYTAPYGLPGVRARAFRRVDLPVFLEGPARYLSACEEGDRETARALAEKLRASELYDEKLKMYKTSASLEGESMEIGRIRAFTPGWLERESVFLHMEYKYIVGLLKAGLYPEFFQALDESLIPHLDPAVYGRSILENSSFIATSVNPDPAVHGKGFQARLSGSTVETLTLWKGMFVGRGGFQLRDGELAYRFAPVLPGSLFDENGEAAFTLCGACAVTFRNPARRDTFGEGAAKARRITLRMGGETRAVEGDTLSGDDARAIREHRVEEIFVELA